MHSLISTFARDLPEEQRYWPLKIIIPPSKSRVLYFATQKDRDSWLRVICRVTRQTDPLDFYRLDTTLG